eukprot:TRINITY_DN10698_c0_g1_i1.p1 TRINITY_DN10698_c0_g1~~TRINITY_DN10698_c0_g1_i1.p1  ORF type:complete len:346 (-),score=74.29 TRINITY_DN10698_c0_g1_i1:80-1117(-)
MWKKPVVVLLISVAIVYGGHLYSDSAITLTEKLFHYIVQLVMFFGGCVPKSEFVRSNIEVTYIQIDPNRDTSTYTSKLLQINENITGILYTPKLQKENYPLIVNLHGGGFVLNHCDDMAIHKYSEALLEASQMMLLCVEYRLAPEHPFPAAPMDIIYVYEWLKSKPIENVNYHQIIPFGDSAGANLAMIFSSTWRDEKLTNINTPIEIPAEVLIYPPLWEYPPLNDPNKDYWVITHDIIDFFQDMYIGHIEGGLEEASKLPLLNPLAHEKGLEGYPDTIFISCGEDILVDAGLVIQEELKKSGVKVWTDHYPNSVHGMITIDFNGPTQDAYKFIFGTLDKILSEE